MASGETTRRDFVAAASGAAVATLLPRRAGAAGGRRRYAIVGTGVRGIGMWGRPLAARYADVISDGLHTIVGLQSGRRGRSGRDKPPWFQRSSMISPRFLHCGGPAASWPQELGAAFSWSRPSTPFSMLIHPSKPASLSSPKIAS